VTPAVPDDLAILDLYCGAGGAAEGYRQAGFTRILGVDIDPMPRYPFQFVQRDAIKFLENMIHAESWCLYDAIHASPPCQAWSDLQKQSKIEYEDFIGRTRELLDQIPLPYVIENVEGAPLLDAAKLCGASTAFPELRVIRHRYFETNWPLIGTECPQKHPLVFTFDKRKPHFGKLDQNTAYVQVTGGGNCSVANARDAMGIDWMTKMELNEAIPPAYARFVGEQLIRHISVNRESAPGGEPEKTDYSNPKIAPGGERGNGPNKIKRWVPSDDSPVPSDCRQKPCAS
jgi:DNA (cytosine-5)-methyltransferase 1